MATTTNSKLSWTAQVVSLNDYKEPLEALTDVIKNGVLHIAPSLSGTGYYWSSFSLPLSQKFDGDNFKFETRVKNTEADGGLSAYDVGLSFASSDVATNSAGAAFMGEDWAVSYTNINALGKAQTGIDSMAVSLSDWHTLAVETKNQKVTTYYDGKQIGQYAYTGKIGDIDSLTISTKGSGSVDWVKATSNDSLILDDSFDSTSTGLIDAVKNQKVVGTAKNDTLNGSDGNDDLTGNAGFDQLTGGKGADKFVYSDVKDAPVSHSKIEIITDFSSAEKDKIDLSKIDADTSKAKDQKFSAPVLGDEFSGVFEKAGQLFFEKSTGILYGNVNLEGAADFAIQLNGVSSLVASDFVL